ncbi:MAG: amidohydrolase [Oscillospiraceae bacterium]|nr:amidohydrolase [Oscillospiraceae bacterium]
MLIKNGQIHDAIHEAGYAADLRTENGKITEIAPELAPKAGEEVVDAAGLWVYPGLVEAHCHTGLHGYCNGPMSMDVNEKTRPVTPEVRAIDSFNPQDEGIAFSREAGVTTICTGPGSSDVVGGTFAAIKTAGTCVDEMILKYPVAMKCAFGENPKKIHIDHGCRVRMGVAARLRETLFAAREYMEAKEAGEKQKYDMRMEAMIPVLKGEIPLKAHVHRADDICTAIRIAKEFGVRLTLEHCTGGAAVIPQIKAAGVPVAVGPLLSSWNKPELIGKSDTLAAKLDAAGIPVSIMTDGPVVLQQYLTLSAEACIRGGMDPFHALQAITINAAKHIGCEDRVGSLEVGKDADIVLWTGDLFCCTSTIKAVYIDGKKVC